MFWIMNRKLYHCMWPMYISGHIYIHNTTLWFWFFYRCKPGFLLHIWRVMFQAILTTTVSICAPEYIFHPNFTLRGFITSCFGVFNNQSLTVLFVAMFFRTGVCFRDSEGEMQIEISNVLVNPVEEKIFWDDISGKCFGGHLWWTFHLVLAWSHKGKKKKR